VRLRFLCLGIVAAASLALQGAAHASLVHPKLGDSLPNSNAHAGGGSGGNNAPEGTSHGGSGGSGGDGGFGGSFIGSGGFGGGGFGGGGFGGGGFGGGGGAAGDGDTSHGLGPRGGGDQTADNNFPGKDSPKGGQDWDPPGSGGWPDGPGSDGPGYPGGDGPTLFADPLGDPGDTPDALTDVDDPVDMPEPSSFALLAASLLGLGIKYRLKSRAR
jgi:hypothetical protein